MTRSMYWSTNAPVTPAVMTAHHKRLDKLADTLNGLEDDGIFVDNLSIYVDGVLYELTEPAEVYGDSKLSRILSKRLG